MSVGTAFLLLMAERRPTLAGFRGCNGITPGDGFYFNHMALQS
jgi:hypothetical protein